MFSARAVFHERLIENANQTVHTVIQRAQTSHQDRSLRNQTLKVLSLKNRRGDFMQRGTQTVAPLKAHSLHQK